MRQSRGVALAADEEIDTEPAPIGGGKVPVLQSLAAGWTFLFSKFPQVFARTWLAAIVLAILNIQLAGKIDPATLNAAALGAYWWVLLAYFTVCVLVLASLYSLALGVTQRPILAGFVIGPDELRYFAAVVLYVLVAGGLLLGSLLVGRELVKIVAFSGGIAELGVKGSPNDVQWFKDMNWLAILIQFIAPLTIASLVLLWFSMRYMFVPLHVIAAQRFAVFDGMAITKHNTWRLLLLTVLLCILLQLVAIGALAGFEAISGTRLSGGAAGFADARAVGEAASGGTYHQGHISVAAPRPAPLWIGATLSTIFDLMAFAVIAGTFAHAYKRVTGAE